MAETESIQNFIDERSPEAFSDLVGEYTDFVKKVLYRIVLNEHDAGDIAQEVFLIAYNKIDTFKGKSKFSTWLCRIAHNRAYSFLRSRSADHIEIEKIPHLKSIEASQPDSIIRTKEAHNEITQALADIPHKLRAAITLVSIENTPLDEAAYILGCPRATVYWRIHKARKILRKKLEHLM